jgi:abortive infection bacteriophage resistance protein
MNPNKTFLTIEEQIAHLKAKKISIGLNEQSVRETLSKTSYYEIVNGYSEPFRFKPNPKSYLRGVSFKEIYALYFFDKRLRTIILPFLLEAESRLKNDVVYAFLSQKRKDGTPSNKNDDYLKVSSYGKTNIKQAMLCIANF